MSTPLRFDRWMERALYDPQKGYYSRRIESVGNRGDFTTAPMISDHLAHAIGKWADQAMTETGVRDLIEFGPGTGALAKAVWKSIPWILRRKCRLHLVEVSAPLEQQQQELLGDKAVWHKTPAAAMDACGGKAIIYSNELVDAFPCRRFEFTSEGWQEIAVTEGETLIPAEPMPDSSIFERQFHQGQRVEVHESYREWLQAWLPLWKAGGMLTIDYGAKAEELYERQAQGSIRAYLLQQRLTGMDIYQNVGRQDLTADINFTDLIRWSQPWVKESKLRPLGEFLVNSGAEKRLLDPEGAGGAFKVLEQRIA